MPRSGRAAPPCTRLLIRVACQLRSQQGLEFSRLVCAAVSPDTNNMWFCHTHNRSSKSLTSAVCPTSPLSSDAQRPMEAQAPRVKAQAHRCPRRCQLQMAPGYPHLCLADYKPGAPTTRSLGLLTHLALQTQERAVRTCAGSRVPSRRHGKEEPRSRQGAGHWASLPPPGTPLFGHSPVSLTQSS